MDKLHPSSARPRSVFYSLSILAIGSSLLAQPLAAINLSEAESQRIGRKVWQNECNGTVAGLTSWNEGEDFASLGIGHFIWYPEGRRGPFDESFPTLLGFVAARGAKLPASLQAGSELHCPWKSRSAFLAAQKSGEMKELRQFLVSTINLQAQFLAERLQNALPKMLAETAPANRARVEQQFQRVAGSPSGRYALIDYVNFKGEGVLSTERYNGQGWGLLQALEEMETGGSDAAKEFSRAAAAILTRRVHNAPGGRNEAKWLPGWLNRVRGYTRG
ncbi:MAG: hypothetical protein ABJB69_06975 [Spartobacteria bacterium]